MYKVHISAFEGPLDLLLHLIQSAKLDIKLVAISAITEQYMEYMDDVGELDMDTASEFLTMAATLLYIKSRSLLPRPRPDNDEEGQSPEEALVRQLREYQAYKQASELIEKLRADGASVFCKLPEEYPLPPPVINIVGLSAEKLAKAFTEAMLRASVREEKQPFRHVVRLDEYNITDRQSHILAFLKKGGATFEELISTGSRAEIVVTFMALLELLANGEIDVVQQDRFDDITIRRRIDGAEG